MLFREIASRSIRFCFVFFAEKNLAAGNAPSYCFAIAPLISKTYPEFEKKKNSSLSLFQWISETNMFWVTTVSVKSPFNLCHPLYGGGYHRLSYQTDAFHLYEKNKIHYVSKVLFTISIVRRRHLHRRGHNLVPQSCAYGHT